MLRRSTCCAYDARLATLSALALLAQGCATTHRTEPVERAEWSAPAPVVVESSSAREPGPDPGASFKAPVAQDAEEMARKLQNPLSNIQAVLTDNFIGFDTGDGGTSYGFNIQPVFAIDYPNNDFTLIPRAIIPILGLQDGTYTPITGRNGTGGGGSTWGLGDTILQAFYAPHTSGKWKWGAGPQLSLPTATSRSLEGPEFGAGVAGVVSTDFTPELSFAAILGNVWSFDGDYSTTTLQPMLYYNLPSAPGTYVAYNAVTAIDWKASSGNKLMLPLGASFGKTFQMQGGKGLDLSIGPYYNVVRPDGAAGWAIRFGISFLFP